MKKSTIISLLICLLLMSGVLASCAGDGAGGGSNTSGGAEIAADDVISDEEAMDIALSRVPGATQEDITRFEMVSDDGHWLYEGEIVYKGIEYDFEIEGHKGAILKWELDN